MSDVALRRMGEADSFEELTDLLHAAYAELLAGGWRAYASHQSVEVTRERAEKGECWVATSDGKLVGTITVYGPGRAEGAPWYRRPGIAKAGQFGVHPDLRGRRVGRRLLETAERRAREMGAIELALDTPETARHLVEMYMSYGYRFVEHADWRPGTNYVSVILSKVLGAQVPLGSADAAPPS